MRIVVPAIAKLSGLTPLAAASADKETPCAAAIPLSVSPGWTAYPPPAATAVDAGCAVVAGTIPADWSAVEASEMLGMLIVLPSTTFEFSDRPFAAASARVEKLLAAAIDQSDSPG